MQYYFNFKYITQGLDIYIPYKLIIMIVIFFKEICCLFHVSCIFWHSVAHEVSFIVCRICKWCLLSHF